MTWPLLPGHGATLPGSEMLLQTILTGATTLGILAVMWLIKMNASDRDRRLEAVEAALRTLIEKVGQQNGRVGRLEEWTDNHTDWAKELAAEVKEITKPSRPQTRRRK